MMAKDKLCNCGAAHDVLSNQSAKSEGRLHGDHQRRLVFMGLLDGGYFSNAVSMGIQVV